MNAAARLARAGSGRLLRIALLATGVLAACSEDAPHDRPESPPRDAGMRGRPRPEDAGLSYDGTCSGETCARSTLGTPCCTQPGTGEAGHELENVGRGPGLCGTDLADVVPALKGICLQIDQPGEADPNCPAQVSISGGAPRPGCCTDEGFCGSLNPLIHLGCFYATGLKGLRCGQDGGVGADEDAGGS